MKKCLVKIICACYFRHKHEPYAVNFMKQRSANKCPFIQSFDKRGESKDHTFDEFVRLVLFQFPAART